MVLAKVYIIILNYKGWRDTIECLESVLKLDHPSFQIVVIDNASGDGSLEQIEAWAAGTEPAGVANLALAACSTPAHPKPLAVQRVTPAQLDRGDPVMPAAGNIVLIQSDDNGGYAAGNNLGIRLAILDPDCAYLWLLNNDTVVDAQALSHLVARVVRDPSVGMCGSTLVHYHQPSTIQAKGGAVFNRWLATSHHVGEGAAYPVTAGPLVAPIAEKIDYVVGASMFVSRGFVEQAGLMYEGYFLYFEEIDWGWRKGRFTIAYEPKSVVFHKEGATTGMNKQTVQYGRGGDFYLHRNRLVFARRNFPLSLPVVALRLGVVFLKSIQAGRWGRARMFLSPRFWFGTGKV
jgi:GT2 family glycosyltransferase